MALTGILVLYLIIYSFFVFGGMLVLTCLLSARILQGYNPIEHLWSPLSKKLCGVQLSSKASGLPCQIAGISTQEQRQKESEVFDRDIDDLCSVHWADVTFDGYPIHVKCVSDTESR